MSIGTILAKIGAGNVRTVRTAIAKLVKDGWLHVAAMTWTQLAAEQRAIGRPVPRREDDGQATNLYTLRDGQGRPVAPEQRTEPTTAGPGIARTLPPTAETSEHATLPLAPAEGGQGQNCPGGQGQKRPGEPGAKAPLDLDPERSSPRIESGASPSGPQQRTHNLRKCPGEEDHASREAWSDILDAYTAKGSAKYGLPPSKSDVQLRREDRADLVDTLNGAAVEVCAKLRQRGLERELVSVRRELAARAIQAFFENNSKHLRDTGHALRDLPREFRAKLVRAMEALLRASHDEQRSRKPTTPPDPSSPAAASDPEKARAVDAVSQLCHRMAPPGQARRVDVAEIAGVYGQAPPSFTAWDPFRPTSPPMRMRPQFGPDVTSKPTEEQNRGRGLSP